METPEMLGLAGALGALGIGMRLIRTYGDEIVEFTRWLRTFVDRMRAALRR
jgi:hypothetical protein